ncbi:MAG: IPT/TIG domain-containing protein [Chloroflexota bacterium]
MPDVEVRIAQSLLLVEATTEQRRIAQSLLLVEATTEQRRIAQSLLLVEAKQDGPVITSLTPDHGAIGTSIVIAGSNFGSSEGSVYFGSIRATVSAWADTAITVTVPAGATSCDVVVVDSDGFAGDGKPWTLGESPGPGNHAQVCLRLAFNPLRCDVILGDSPLVP